MLRNLPVELHLVVTRSAEMTLAYETDLKLFGSAGIGRCGLPNRRPRRSALVWFFSTLGMVVAPCSVRSLGEIASGVSSTLLTRAADVTLKERRRLVLMVRETPLHLGHLRAMVAVTGMGAVITPPVPAFYARPQSLDEMVDHTLGRVLDLFGLNSGTVKRWGAKPSVRKGARRSQKPLSVYGRGQPSEARRVGDLGRGASERRHNCPGKLLAEVGLHAPPAEIGGHVSAREIVLKLA